MASPPTLDFFFEFGSTYSYLSAVRVEKLAAETNVEISWEPFLLGPIFAAQGWDDSPFNIYEAKGRYMWRDIKRRSEDDNVPFRKPSVFPRNSLLATRVAFLAKREAWMGEFAKAVFRANFVEDEDISDAEVIGEILRSHGQSERWIEAAKSSENKEALKKQTGRAMKLGIFGAPSFVAGDGELFWGDDRMEEALAWASGERSLP